MDPPSFRRCALCSPASLAAGLGLGQGPLPPRATIEERARGSICAGDLEMATMAMAQAVLEHANTYYDVGVWYVVAECWDAWAILEELDRHELAAGQAFELELGAISHFSDLIARGRW